MQLRLTALLEVSNSRADFKVQSSPSLSSPLRLSGDTSSSQMLPTVLFFLSGDGVGHLLSHGGMKPVKLCRGILYSLKGLVSGDTVNVRETL